MSITEKFCHTQTPLHLKVLQREFVQIRVLIAKSWAFFVENDTSSEKSIIHTGSQFTPHNKTFYLLSLPNTHTLPYPNLPSPTHTSHPTPIL